MGHALVGRGDESKRFEQAFAQAQADRTTRVLHLTGEPGIGKTTMVEWMAQSARDSGATVIQAVASESLTPLAVLRDAVGEWLETLTPYRQQQLEREDALEGLWETDSPGTRQAPDRWVVQRRFRELLERADATQPVLLSIDDAQLIDPASADVLIGLLSRRPRLRLLIVLASRSGLPPNLGAALDRAEQELAVERLTLGPLEGASARELVHCDDDMFERVYRESGGNPFYLMQLASPSGDPVGPGAGESVPRLVAARIMSEVQGLTPAARTLLESATIVGDPFVLDIAAKVAGLDRAAALEAIDELVTHELTRPTGQTRRFGFRHSLVCRAIYESLPASTLLTMHERAVDTLTALGAGPAGVARHVEGSASYGDLDAAETLRSAGVETRHQSPQISARWLRSALDLVPPAETTNDLRMAILGELAQAQADGGRFQEARSVLIELLAAVPKGDGERERQVLAACSEIEHLLGLHREAHERLIEAFRKAGPGAGVERAGLLLGFALDAFHMGDLERMLVSATDAKDIADVAGEESLVAACSAIRTVALEHLDHIPEAEIAADETSQMLDRLSDDQLSQHLEIAAFLGTAESCLSRLTEAEEHFRRGLRVAAATRQGRLVPMMLAMLGLALAQRGELVEALDVTSSAVDAARLSGSDHALSWALYSACFALTSAGRLDEAIVCGAESLRLAQSLEIGYQTPHSAGTLAWALVEAGDYDAGISTLLTGAGGPELTGMYGDWKPVYLGVWARAELGRGRVEQAVGVLAALASSAERVDTPLARSIERRVRAMVCMESGAIAEARDLALEGAVLAERIGAAGEALHSRLLAARALARLEPTSDARVGAAADELEQCARDAGFLGYRSLERDAATELRASGGRYSAAGRFRPAAGFVDECGLTAREREVADQVMHRMTNREIASALFLSEKTVETHLRNVFRKLGVGSRREVARLLEQDDHELPIT